MGTNMKCTYINRINYNIHVPLYDVTYFSLKTVRGNEALLKHDWSQ